MKKLIDYDGKGKCCGCRACELICPVKAISMEKDEEGFLYPIINKSICVNCGKCYKTCDFSQRIKKCNPKVPSAFVCVHKNKNVRRQSRSGGVFVAISDYVLEKGGYVYGVEFADDFSVRHTRAESPQLRNKFCGSKYVQSDTGNSFESVYIDLTKGGIVLFSGTACQVGGLYKYLSSKGLNEHFYNNLITCDIVCHGVVSPKIWADNLQYIENKFNAKILSANFRDKSFGWNSHIESYYINNETITNTLYTSIFYEHVALRPSCYNCPYTSTEREADITLADAWGIAKKIPAWDDDLGHSLVLVNTVKGHKIFSKILTDIESVEVKLLDFMQPNLVNPTSQPKNREVFCNAYRKRGYVYVARKCKKRQMKIKKWNQIKSLVVKALRKLRLK